MWSLRTAFARVLLAGALCLPTAAVFVPSDASASVSIAVAYEALIKDADAVAVITAGEHTCVWEDGRIYTYTKVKVDQGVAGDMGAGADGYVRTMGGVVGKIGQLVDGEPVFVAGKSSLLFLRKFKAGAIYEVSARAQGQYAIKIDDNTKVRRLMRSSAAGLLLPPKKDVGLETAGQVKSQSQPQAQATTPPPARLAHEVMHDRALDDVTRELAKEWKRLHPPAPTK